MGALVWRELQQKGSLAADYQAAARAEMSRPIPNLPSKYLFDDLGSDLFSQFLSATPEHFSNIERALVPDLDRDIIDNCENLVELGTGDASTLLQWFERGAFSKLISFTAVDFSAPRMTSSLSSIRQLRPALCVTGMIGDFELTRAWIPERGGLVCWLGNSAANLPPAALESFLTQLREQRMPLNLLLGISLNGQPQKFPGFYASGREVFDAFRLNSLTRMNRECGADFKAEQFRALSHYDADLRRGQSIIEATSASRVTFQQWGSSREFQTGDRLIVGETHNYSRFDFESLISRTGWRSEIVAVDPASLYAMVLLA